MATLYNQYIYKNGAWMKIGTSSDSVTYSISYLNNTLTLTGSDGSTSTVTIESGSSDAITGITVNGTTVTVTDGVAAISVPTTLSAFTNDAGYITTPAFKITVTENNGTYTADKTYAEVESAINAGYICYISYEPYYYYYTMYLPGEGYYFEITSVTSYRIYFCYMSDGTLFQASEPIVPSFSATSPIAVMGSSTVTYYLQDNYGDTKNPYASKTKNYVLAAPSTANGAPSFRALVATDIPTLTISKISDFPTNVSSFTNDAGYITSYTETDPVFSASAAAGITSTDITNWNNKVSDDKTWNGVSLTKSFSSTMAAGYVPYVSATTDTSANYYPVAKANVPAANAIPKYNSEGYLSSNTPSSNDNTTKVATTSFVKTALSTLDTDIGELRTDIATAQTDIFALDSHKSNAGQDIYIGASLDDCTTAGWYYIDPSTTTENTPDSFGGILEVIRTSSNDAGAVLQRFTAVNNDGITYMRYDANATGSFTEWQRMG